MLPYTVLSQSKQLLLGLDYSMIRLCLLVHMLMFSAVLCSLLFLVTSRSGPVRYGMVTQKIVILTTVILIDLQTSAT